VQHTGAVVQVRITTHSTVPTRLAYGARHTKPASFCNWKFACHTFPAGRHTQLARIENAVSTRASDDPLERDPSLDIRHTMHCAAFGRNAQSLKHLSPFALHMVSHVGTSIHRQGTATYVQICPAEPPKIMQCQQTRRTCFKKKKSR
jgi:hypothetical protein